MTEDRTTLAIFSGKRENYALWSINFLARAKTKGYEDYLLGTKPIPTGTTDAMVVPDSWQSPPVSSVVDSTLSVVGIDPTGTKLTHYRDISR